MIFFLFQSPLQHNTFQSVYATDGTTWYSFNFYLNGRMLYESSMPFIGMIANGVVSGLSENRDGTPLLRPDETLLYETSSGEFIILIRQTNQ